MPYAVTARIIPDTAAEFHLLLTDGTVESQKVKLNGTGLIIDAGTITRLRVPVARNLSSCARRDGLLRHNS